MAKIDKNLKGATYANPYQQPYANSDFSQNEPAPTGSGGGPAYENPYSAVDKQFFDPKTPNDSAFSDMQAMNEVSSANPLGQIMSDFKDAQAQLNYGGGK